MFYDAVRVKQNRGSWLLVTCVNSRCDNPAAGKGNCLSPHSPRIELAPANRSLLKICLHATKWLHNCPSAPSQSCTSEVQSKFLGKPGRALESSFSPPLALRTWTSFLKDNAGLGQGENEWLKRLWSAAGLSKMHPSLHPSLPPFFFFF